MLPSIYYTHCDTASLSSLAQSSTVQRFTSLFRPSPNLTIPFLICTQWIRFCFPVSHTKDNCMYHLYISLGSFVRSFRLLFLLIPESGAYSARSWFDWIKCKCPRHCPMFQRRLFRRRDLWLDGWFKGVSRHSCFRRAQQMTVRCVALVQKEVICISYWVLRVIPVPRHVHADIQGNSGCMYSRGQPGQLSKGSQYLQ